MYYFNYKNGFEEFPKTYCLVCKKLTDNNNIEKGKNNKRLMVKLICPICGNKKIDLFHKDLVY